MACLPSRPPRSPTKLIYYHLKKRQHKKGSGQGTLSSLFSTALLQIPAHLEHHPDSAVFENSFHLFNRTGILFIKTRQSKCTGHHEDRPRRVWLLFNAKRNIVRYLLILRFRNKKTGKNQKLMNISGFSLSEKSSSECFIKKYLNTGLPETNDLPILHVA